MGEAEITREALVDFLREQGVNTATWGTGKAKSLDDLLEEVHEGESRLIVFEEGLRRVTPIDQIEVRYRASDGSLYKLVEQKQVFNDGRESKEFTLFFRGKDQSRRRSSFCGYAGNWGGAGYCNRYQ